MVQLTEPDNSQLYGIVQAEPGDDLAGLDVDDLKTLFRTHGALLFRGFDYDLEGFSAFTRRFCSRFVANGSIGRREVSADGTTQTVNLGQEPFPLHPELSRVPWRPDVAWFACQSPPARDGETLVCDGAAIVEALSDGTRDALAGRELLYREETPTQVFTEWLGMPPPDAAALARLSADSPFDFTLEDGRIWRSFRAPALDRSLFSGRRVFANFLLFARLGLGYRDFPSFEDGGIIPDGIVAEVAAVSDRLKVGHAWRTGDILMLDNSRIMHGRNRVHDARERLIWTQFGYADFLDADDPRRSQPWRHTDDPRVIFLGRPDQARPAAAGM